MAWRRTIVVVFSVAVAAGLPLGALIVAQVVGGQDVRRSLVVLGPVLWPLVYAGAAVILLLGVASLAGRERLGALRDWIGGYRWGPAIAQSLLAVVVLGGFLLAAGVAAAIDNIGVLVLMIGGAIAGSAFRRLGDVMLCANCEYEQAGPATSSDERDDRCPECGAFWRRPGATVKGRRHTHRGPLICGIGLLALGFILMMDHSIPQLQRVKMALVPTGVLIHAVVNGNGRTEPFVDAIDRRSLSAEQELRLIRGLLDKRANGEGLFGAERAWLETAFVADRLPPDLHERFFSDEVEVRLHAPRRGRVGEEVEVALHVRHRGMNSGNVHSMQAAFGGYFVDAEDEARSRAEQPIYASLLGRVRPSFGRDRGPARLPEWDPSTRITLTEPGTVRVRAVMWLYAVPGRGNAGFTWNEDGTPALPGGTMWVRRVDLEHQIEVVP